MPEEQSQQTEAPVQQGGRAQLPEVNYLTASGDDYVYESKPLPKRVVEDLDRAAQSGGMASQFETISSGLSNGA